MEGFWDGTDLYLFKQHRFTNVPDVKTWLDAHSWYTNEVEGKPKTGGGGYNAGYADHLMSLGAQCQYNMWEDNSKDLRLALLQRATVYVHPECSWFIRNWNEATFKKSLVPQLEKTPTQHGLDCALHMVNTGGGIDFTGGAPQQAAAQRNFNSAYGLLQFRR